MLNKYNFKSIFKIELNNFILYKRSLGLDYEKEISRLKYIDNILFDLCTQILSIKNKKVPTKMISYFTEEEIKFLLLFTDFFK